MIGCLVPTVQHLQSMSRRVRRPTRWNLQLQALRKNIAESASTTRVTSPSPSRTNRSTKHEDKHHHYLRREFSYSNYEQSYTLPDDVVKDQISAKVEDGILTVTMPKTEPKQKVTKAIEVS